MDLSEVYADTKTKCTSGKYKDIPIDKSELYIYKQLNLERRFPKTNVIVVNQDTLLTCKVFATSDNKDINNVCALNMANEFHAGGAVEHGARAQEEELFRRTNYFKSLTEEFYPIERPNCVYTPNVSCIKDENYKDLENEEIFSCAFIASPAIVTPDTKEELIDGKFSMEYVKYKKMADKLLMCRIIDNIFACAYDKGHTTLVLGALGCGVFRNPPKEVVDIFNMALDKYDGCFNTVAFSVLSKRDKNYEIFDKFIDR
uniref:Microbial-type PARG catalytic domain-containing protein n=1 Tax=viral metagenome TaxID=1070528 RepID=A0A6C0EAX9_9ZZZZ